MKQIRTCMICGTHHHVLQEGSAALCARCLEALADALGNKLPHSAPQGERDAVGRPLIP